MSDYRPVVAEYIRASEALLQVREISDEEREVVQGMSDRLSEILLRSRTGSKS